MKHLIIAETRKLGVDYLANLILQANIIDILQRSQTRVTTEKDSYIVVTKLEHLETPNSNDRGMIVGAVSAELLEGIRRTYQARRFAIEIAQADGRVLSATELKRRQLQIQMADLDTEERVNMFFSDIKIPGVTIRAPKMITNSTSRSFTIEINGKFD